ncbi:hypothetical protein M431DRAFT_458561 [Trichoderma harzianum CBS 226.95]|uniref:Uncharacterized protein n=1 Tax=Trichoderma harzianum CBS 226.95 TaxID=983964 RepID=A0A2T4A7V8_TRIHA|nr:hypothetical protein M431DRAFT_458561 [Trichoderma harzianum CBS 226.95]PTB53159.1 hypothetical protein M431DRAFT_458561 [Trichoderma harzianum CBS 226.95]
MMSHRRLFQNSMAIRIIRTDCAKLCLVYANIFTVMPHTLLTMGLFHQRHMRQVPSPSM